MGPMGDQKEDHDCSVNFVFTKDSHVQQGNLLRDEVSRQRISKQTKKLEDEKETAQHFKDKMDIFQLDYCGEMTHHT